MRIIIEVQPSDLRPSMNSEAAEEATIVQTVMDGGEPAEHLVTVLGGARETEPESASIPDYNAGPVPDWLLAALQEDVSTPQLDGNGIGQRGSPIG
jgi:hypothetical protein